MDNEKYDIDIYSAILGPKSDGKLERLILPWVPPEDRRRLLAYRLYWAYYHNYSQILRQSGTDPDCLFIEGGDAQLIVDTFADSVIGDQLILEPADMIDEQGKENTELRRQLDLINSFRTKEMLDLKILSAEVNASMMGDGVFKLRWSERKKRVKIQPLPPDSYFPEFDEDDELVAFAFAWQERINEKDERVYKEYYEFDDEGKVRCTAGYYKKSKKAGLDDLELESYVKNELGEEVNFLSLGIDFLPVIHIPNVIIGGETFGVSDLKPIVQLLDEHINAQSSGASNAEYLGDATLLVEGKKPTEPPQLPHAGGILFSGTDGGRMDLLDTSSLNDGILKWLDYLETKIVRNAGVTEVAIGKVSGNEIPSGVALQILQHRFLRNIYRKRLIRADKYERLLKFVTRFYRAFGEREQRFDNEEFTVKFGNVLPIDRRELIEEITLAVNSGILTPETAVELLRTMTGWEIPDDEADRLEKATATKGLFGL